MGIVEQMIGNGLAHPDADDPADDIVETFQVLDIEGGPDVDAGAQQFFDILPAFGVTRTGNVAVSQFIHQQHRRTSRQRGIQIELAEGTLAMHHVVARQQFQTGEQFSGFPSAMGFDHARHQVTALGHFALGRGEHGTGFPHPGIGAEIDAQFAAQRGLFVLLQLLQQRVGIRAAVA